MTTDPTWPRDLLTLAEWERLPFDEYRHAECVEGVLVMAPSPVVRHQVATMNIANALNQALPASLRAIIECELVLTEQPPTVRIPDVVVVDRSTLATDPARFLPDQVRLIVEVMSPGSRRQDRVMKYAEYAEAGIADYWIVDLDGPSVAVHRLGTNGTYQHVSDLHGRVAHRACDVDITVDVDAIAQF